jgi:quinol monooxygenase YgiN
MATKDQVVSIHPYFKVFEGKMPEFKKLCDQFISLTAKEPKCLYYGFSFSADIVHCREAYDDAEALLTHLANVDAVIKAALQISTMERLEVHGVAEELAKLEEPMAALSPTYFTLEYGIRR